MPSAPKVFVSHASEDKQRFVVAFAERLRQSGVDAWLDQWEMQPGDSLVDKVFEDGLARAQAVIVVISAASVKKPWVREELNLAVVKKIGKGLKLIPVVIDACEIPTSLQSTIWQRIDDLENYDDAFQRILGAIFDTSTKPALGTPPKRFADAEPKLEGLTRTDERVLREIAYREVDLNDWPVTEFELVQDPDLAGVSREELLESFEMLERGGLIVLEDYGPGLHARLSLVGFERWASAYVDDYPAVVKSVAGCLLNQDVRDNNSLAARLEKPLNLIHFVLSVLEAQGHIKLAKFGGGLWEVWRISPSLKRALA